MHIDKINVDLVHTVLKYLTRYEFRFFYLFLLSLFWGWIRHRYNPELLSNQVRSEFKKYKKELKGGRPFHETLASPIFTIVIFCLPIFTSLLVVLRQFFWGQVRGEGSDIGGFLSTLHTTCAIIASFTGILVTIVIFAINMNRDYVGGIDSLPRFFLQRVYFKPIISFATGSVAGMLVNSMLASLFKTYPITNVVFFFVLVGALVLILNLCFLFRTVNLLGRNTMNEIIAETYKIRHQNSHFAYIKQRIFQNLFIKNLEKIGINYALWSLLADNMEKAEYVIGKNNYYVNDIDFKYLKRLSRKLNISIEDKKLIEQNNFNLIREKLPEVCVLPGQKLYEKNQKFIVPKAAYEPKVNSLIKRAFRCSKKDKLQVKPVDWPEFSQLLKSLIQQKDDLGIKNLLSILENIIKNYLDVRKKIDWPHHRETIDDYWLSKYRPPTLTNLDLHGILKTIIDSNYDEGLDNLGSFLFHIADIAFISENKDYFDEGSSFVNLVYTMGIKSDKDKFRRAAIGETRRLYRLLNDIFKGYIYSKENKDINAGLKHLSPFVMVYLKNILDLLRELPKYEDIETFTKLIEMMNSLLDRWLKDNIEYMTGSTNKEQKESVIQLHDEKLRCNLLLAAWLYKKTNDKKYDPEKIKPYINKAMGYILDFKDLIEIYLLTNGSRSHESELEYDWWELREREPGESQEGSAFGNWIQPFWIIVALRRAISRPRISIKGIRLFEGIREFDCQILSQRMDNILKNYDHKWLTAEDDIGKGAKYLLGVFGALAQRQRKIDFEKIISDNVSELAVQNFKKRCIEAYKNKVKLRNLLAKYEKPSQEDVVRRAEPLRKYLHYVDKEDLVGEGRDTGLAHICGEDMARWENLRYSGSIEDGLIEKGHIQSFQELEAKIKNEATFLREKGYDPKIILIPRDIRYEKALTNVPHWKRKCPLENGPFPRWVASIDGMEIFVWPHHDSECVGIIDIGAFARFIEREDAHGEPLRISFRNLNEKELHQSLIGETKQRNRSEFKKWLRTFEYDMGKAAEMRRIVVIENKMILELLDCNAGVKLLPTNEAMGIVYKEGEQVYHLPECKLAQKIPATERRYFRTIGLAKLKQNDGFLPCDECHPDYER